MLGHGSDLQSNVIAKNGKGNIVGNDRSNSLQNGVIENEKVPADDNDAVVDKNVEVSDDAKGITNKKRKLSTDSEDNINGGSAKDSPRSAIFLLSLSLICLVKPAL